jgi:rubrerythrin
MEPTQTEGRDASTGALDELANDAASRSKFLRMVGGAGAAGAFSLLLAACGSGKKSASATTAAPAATGTSTTTATAKTGTEQFGAGDLGIANYALTLEYLEAEFYKEVAASGLFKGTQLQLIKKFGDSERQHVDALTALIKSVGGKPAPKPKTQFPIDNAKSVLKLAATVENLGAAAYLGQAGNIKDKKILAAALSIHTVEARHASALNRLLGMDASPDGAFSKPATADEVLKAVKPFIVA